MNAVLAIAGADTAERTRRFAFVLTVAAALYAGYLYVPDAHSAYHTVVIHGHTGVYNSAFYGATIAALTDGFLALFGFFLVRGAVERDVECHVDEIVGGSAVRKSTFVISKWLSNCVVLWAVGGVSYIAAMAMEMVRSHTLHVDVLAYGMPYLLITVPAMAFVAAVAAAFDIIPFLRGVLGGIVFVMLWPAMLTAQFFDPLGFNILSSNLIAAERHAFPANTTRDVNFGVIVNAHLGQPFLFSGFSWTGAVVTQRLGWFIASALVVVVASMFFDRFRREKARKRGSIFIDVARLIPNVSFLRIFRAEFGLIANGANIFWYLGALGIIVAGAIVPLGNVAKIVLPLALIWPLERLSALGARERFFGVEEIVSSTAGFATKTLVSQWFAGTLLTLILGSSCMLRLTTTGDAMSIIACVTVAAAMSAVALALGTTFGASRVFEALFLIVWYLGPVQHLPGIDFANGMFGAPVLTSIICAIIAALGVVVARLHRTVTSQRFGQRRAAYARGSHSKKAPVESVDV